MATPETFGALPREKAEDVPREQAERTFTEVEHDAIVASRVAQETASLTEINEGLKGQVETLKSEKASVDEKLELMTAAKEEADQKLADFVEAAEEKERIEGLKAERAEKLRATVNAPDTFFTPEKAARWAGMAEPDFDEYLTELTDAFGAAGTKPAPEKASTVTGAPLGEPKTEKKASSAFFGNL